MEKIFEKLLRIYQKDMKSHIRIDFLVDKEYTKLVLKTYYCPKYDFDRDRATEHIHNCYIEAGRSEDFEQSIVDKALPLANHIAWSIDSPDAYLGTKHLSWAFQEHCISEQESSYGFLPSPIKAGKWTLTASTNAIVSPYVDIWLVVEGEV